MPSSSTIRSVWAGAWAANWGVNAGLFGQNASDQQDNEGYALAGRGHYAFLYGPEDSGNAIHLGASARYRNFDNDTFDSEIRYRQRPFFHFTGTRSVDTGTIGDAEGDVWIGSGVRLGTRPVLAAERGREHRAAAHERAGRCQQPVGRLSRRQLFPDRRASQLRPRAGSSIASRSSGHSRKVAPEPGSWPRGADYIDLNNEGVKGGEQISYIGGVNWYANDYVRFMLDGAVTQVFDAENSEAAATATTT